MPAHDAKYPTPRLASATRTIPAGITTVQITAVRPRARSRRELGIKKLFMPVPLFRGSLLRMLFVRIESSTLPASSGNGDRANVRHLIVVAVRAVVVTEILFAATLALRGVRVSAIGISAFLHLLIPCQHVSVFSMRVSGPLAQ